MSRRLGALVAPLLALLLVPSFAHAAKAAGAAPAAGTNAPDLAERSFEDLLADSRDAYKDYARAVAGAENAPRSDLKGWPTSKRAQGWSALLKDGNGLHFIDRATQQAINEQLASLPREITGGYQIPKRYFDPGTRTQNPLFRVVERLNQISKNVRRHERETAPVRRAQQRIAHLERELGQRFGRLQAAEAAKVRGLLADGSDKALDEVTQHALTMRQDLGDMLGRGDFLKERVLVADSRTTSRKVAETTRLERGGSFGFDLASLGFSIGVEASDLRTTERESFDSKTRVRGSTVVPGVLAYNLHVLAPVTSALKANDAATRRFLGTWHDPRSLTRFEARVLLAKAAALKSVVDSLAVAKGGRALPPQLGEWMDSRVILWGSAKESSESLRLGNVELASAPADILGAEAVARRQGYTLVGNGARKRLASNGRNAAFARAAGSPGSGAAPPSPVKAKAPRQTARR